MSETKCTTDYYKKTCDNCGCDLCWVSVDDCAEAICEDCFHELDE